MTVADILMKRKRLRIGQNEAAKMAGLNPGSIVDIERERLVVSENDLIRINAAYDKWAKENTNWEEVTA